MNNEEKYKQLDEEDISLPSDMAAIANSPAFQFKTDSIKESLKESKDFRLISFNENLMKDESSKAEKKYSVEVEYESYTFDVELGVYKNDVIDFNDYVLGNMISEDELRTAKAQPYHLNVEMYFKEESLLSFHLQLKILNAIVPDASLCIDFMPARMLSGRWLSMAAKSKTPPSPDYLYTTHGVYDDSTGERIYWLHTHGLHRCGSVEVEMVNLKQGPNEMHTLLQMIANKLLTDPVKEKERFMIGYDGMGIDVCWLRWEEALKDFPNNILGGLDERRKDEYNIHAEPCGVIFAVEDGNMISPEIYAKTLADNPIYYISTEETLRMSALAKERFGMFKQVYDSKQSTEKESFLGKLFSGKDKNKEKEWSFIVKLGLEVDDPQAGSEREHLWFEVKEIDTNNNIKGKLMNEPYWISGLKRDDVNTYPFELLTDWLIYGPESNYNTDTIYQLGV